MRNIIFTFSLCLYGLFVYPQDYNALSLLYARDGVTGTARTAGSGNAYGSIGADLGSIDINPAGLGFYRSTDICITPALKIASNQTTYLGYNTHSILALPLVGQAGVAFTKVFPQKADKTPPLLRTFTFALNYQTQSFFARRQIFEAVNRSSTLVDFYTAASNAYGQTLLEESLMQSVGLIDSTNLGYTSSIRAPVQQTGTIETRGATSKIDMAFGGNIADKVYFGFSLSLPILTYNMNETMTEVNQNDSVIHFQSYTLNSVYNQDALGFTGNLGLIYRPFQFLRVGVSYHLPTWYAIRDNYASQIQANYDTAILAQQGYFQETRFSLRTPMKGTVSMSYFIKQTAFFSVDYEFQNLKSSYYHTGDPAYPPGYFDTLNVYNKQIYHFSHTIRFGFEAAVKVMRFRAGYSFSNTPYQAGQVPSSAKGTVNNLSVGLGLRLKNFYADLAYVASFTKDINSSDSLNSGVINSLLYTTQVNNKYITHNLLLTVGWKFTKDSAAPKRKVMHATPPPLDIDQQQY